jgi:CBS domain-containing protein
MSCSIESIVILNVPTLQEDLTVWEAASRMIRYQHGHIVLTSPGDESQVTGFFTERDLMVRVVGQKLNPEQTIMRDVMSTKLVTVDVSTSCRHCLELMRASRCRHLLVFNHGRYVGVISLRDVAALLGKHSSIQEWLSKGLVGLFVTTITVILIFLLSFVPKIIELVK